MKSPIAISQTTLKLPFGRILGFVMLSLALSLSPLRVWSADCVLPPAGLVAWWPGQGNANDIVGTNNGTLMGGVTFTNGEVGQAFCFGGDSYYVSLPPSDSLNFSGHMPMSVETWVYRTGNLSVMHILGKRAGCGSIQYQLSFDAGDGLAFLGDGNTSWVSTHQDLPMNTWQHLAVTYDGTSFVFYINGNAVTNGTGSLGPANTAPLQIGNSGSCRGFFGLIDEVCLYDRALSAFEIQAVYNAGSAGKCRPLGITVNVPGKSNPWLAGMPDGSVAGSGYDTAPNASPVQAAGVQVGSGVVFTFSGSGGANHVPDGTPIGPEGDASNVIQCWSAPENGMANITAPLVALLGVFLDDSVPSQFPPPPALDFSTAEERDFFTIQPALRQPFFIGDGLTSGHVTQQFVAPVGATRLYLGTMDGNDWSDNSGSFSVTVTNVSPCFPYRATATATLVNGSVVEATISELGGGYTNTPLVRFIGAGGSGAQAVAVVSNGVVIAINIMDAGYGYTNAPLIVIQPPFIPNPVLSIAPMSFLSFSNLTVGGVYQLQKSVAWYWSNQPVSFTATSAIYTQMVPGVASSGDYRLVLNPVPSQAFATAEVYYGFVVNATVTTGGSGYVTTPAVTIVADGAGSNATAVAQLSGGVVTSIIMTDAGIGYTNTPTVEIDPPPAAAVSPTVLPVMRVDSASLSPYDNYQIQSKSALGGAWANWNGGLFSPTDVTNSQYLFITNGVGFFRLQYVP